MIHPTAIVSPNTEIGDSVEIGPYSVIGDNVKIDEGSFVGPHVLIEGHTIIGQKCQVGAGTVIGSPPQDDKYCNEPTKVIIGDETHIREYVTIHRATGEGKVTRVGRKCRIMAYSHLAHNCEIGNGVTIANYGGMSGHTVIEDNAVIGGMVGSHQFVRVGRLAMVSGFSKISVDIPPFALADGKPARVVTLNVRGMRRAGMDSEVRARLAKAFKILYRSNLNLTNALALISSDADGCPELSYLINFLEKTRNGFAGRANDPQGRQHG